MGVKFTNNATAELASSITDVQTTIVLASGQGAKFPALGVGDYFYATLVNPSNELEIVKVTARSTDTLTVLRAQEGTSSRAYNAGERLELRVTAGALNGMVDDTDSALTLKADLDSPVFTGTPAGPTAAQGTNTTQLATTAFVRAALESVYPVGSVYINAASSTSPATLLGFGTWVEFGAGRVLVGQNTSDASFDVLEETGGSADAIVVAHTHSYSGTTSTAGAHTHSFNKTIILGSGTDGNQNVISGGGNVGTLSIQSAGDHSHTFSGTTASTGSSATNANLQPYIVVKMWKRTA